nr:unnamed protein product [Callosobruchus analis]
MCAKSRRER